MGRSTVSTTFVRAGSRQMKKKGEIVPHSKLGTRIMRKPEPLSEIAQFIKDNQDPVTGLPSSYDLLKEFQENVCGHKFVPFARLGHYNSEFSLHHCPKCGATKTYGRR